MSIGSVVLKFLGALASEPGVEEAVLGAVAQFLAARAAPEKAKALLDAEYAAVKAVVDAEARVELGG